MSIDMTESTQETAPEVDLAADESNAAADNAVTDDDSAASENAENLEAQSQEAKPDDVEIPISEVDPFAEFETKPLTTMEAVKAAFPRVSDAARERILDYGTKLDAALTQIGEVGATGIQFAKEILPVLNNPNPGKAECETVFQSLSDANPTLVVEMGQVLLDRLLNDERSYADTANGLVQAEFGSDVTLERLHQLVGWDKGGLIDDPAFQKEADARGIGKPSAREEAVNTQLETALGRIKELEGKTNSTEQAAIDKAKGEADDWLSSRVMEPVMPIVEKFGWVAKDTDKPEIKEAKIRLGDMVTAYLEREARKRPSYANYEHLRDSKQVLFSGREPVRLLRVNADDIAGSNEALIQNTIRVLQPLINDTLRYKSTPRQTKTTVSEAATNDNGSRAKIEPPKQWTNNDPPPFNPKNIDKAVQGYVAAKRDSAIKVGQQ